MNFTTEPGSAISVPLFVKSPQTSKTAFAFNRRVAPELITTFRTDTVELIVGFRLKVEALIYASTVHDGEALHGAVPQFETDVKLVSTEPDQFTEDGLEAIGDPIQSRVKPVTKLGGFQLSIKIR